MTIYYVKTDGDDADDGLTYDKAWLTLDHAYTTIANGDTVTLHQGTYAVPAAFDPPLNSIWIGAACVVPEATILDLPGGVTFTKAGVTFRGLSIGDGSFVSMTMNGSGFSAEFCRIACLIYGTAAGATFESCTATSYGVIYNTITNGSVIDCDFSTATLVMGFLGDNITITNYIGPSSTEVLGYNATINGFTGGLRIYGSSTNAVTNIDIDGQTMRVDKDGGGDGIQAVTACSNVGMVRVAAAAALNMSFSDKAYYQHSMNIYTTVSILGATSMNIGIVATDVVLTKRDFEMTTDVECGVMIDTWQTTGERNKEWKVSGVGAITLAFSISDMGVEDDYELTADDATESIVKSDDCGSIDFAYAGSFSVKVLKAAMYYRSKKRIIRSD